VRPLDALLSSDPAWPIVVDLVARRPTSRVLPLEGADGDQTLWCLQVTDRSPMGAIARHTCGIVADAGWLRIFGSGDPGLVAWNDTPGGPATLQEPVAGTLVVGADILGGFFLLDGGGLRRPGHVHYLAPDTLGIEDLGVGYTGWLEWALTGNTAGFYGPLRWDGWEAEVAPLAWSHGIHAWPPPWSREGRDVGSVSRRAVPLRELWGSNGHFRRQFANALRNDPPR
jgi:hypothetical protein